MNSKPILKVAKKKKGRSADLVKRTEEENLLHGFHQTPALLVRLRMDDLRFTATTHHIYLTGTL